MATRKKAAPTKLDVIDVALKLAAERGWRNLGLAEIAGEAGVTLAELFAQHPSKTAILQAFSRRIDVLMIEVAGRDAADGAARDRLFAVVMARFDALAPHKEALRRIVRDTALDPAALLSMACAAEVTLTWMLELSGLSANGLGGALRRKGLGLMCADVTRIVLRGDSADNNSTMAALDKRLARVEALIGRLRRKPAEAAA